MSKNGKGLIYNNLTQQNLWNKNNFSILKFRLRKLDGLTDTHTEFKKNNT
jgi:hypothetical protein